MRVACLCVPDSNLCEVNRFGVDSCKFSRRFSSVPPPFPLPHPVKTDFPNSKLRAGNVASLPNELSTLFFLYIRTSNFAAEAEPFLFFSRFEPKMFLECS